MTQSVRETAKAIESKEEETIKSRQTLMVEVLEITNDRVIK